MNNTIQKHNRIRFEYLFITYFTKVKSYAFKLLKSEIDAEDVAQEVFVSIWRQAEKNDFFKIKEEYLFVVTKNKVYNFIRNKNKRTRCINTEDDLANFIDSSENIESTIYSREIKLIERMTMEKMPSQRRKIYRMSRIDHLKNVEIAERLKISVRTVERHLYLALLDVKKHLKTEVYYLLIAYYFLF